MVTLWHLSRRYGTNRQADITYNVLIYFSSRINLKVVISSLDRNHLLLSVGNPLNHWDIIFWKGGNYFVCFRAYYRLKLFVGNQIIYPDKTNQIKIYQKKIPLCTSKSLFVIEYLQLTLKYAQLTLTMDVKCGNGMFE